MEPCCKWLDLGSQPCCKQNTKSCHYYVCHTPKIHLRSITAWRRVTPRNFVSNDVLTRVIVYTWHL
ncbi:hypothetical protein HanIR_Chr15g0749811 [Helianthus annuus]|nr:hypothetical protein HanIR_Chr15g0749811 [Helianthus annuus]